MEFDTQWKVIEEQGINLLLSILKTGISKDTKSISPAEFTKIYTISYNLSTQRNANYKDILYQKHSEIIQSYLQSLPEIKSAEILFEISRRWSNMQIMNRWLEKFFMYLEKYHIPNNNLPKLTTNGLDLFKNHMFLPNEEMLRSALLDQINSVRDKTNSDISIELFKLYKTMDKLQLIEDGYSLSTDIYYSSKLPSYLELNCSDYLNLVSKIIAFESSMLDKLNVIDKQRIFSQLQKMLLMDQNILESGFVKFLDNQSSQIDLVYELYSVIDQGLQKPGAIMEKHIIDTANELTKERNTKINETEKYNQSVDVEYIKSIIKLFSDYDTILKRFKHNAIIGKNFHNAFLTIINVETEKKSIAEIISMQIDRIVTSSDKDSTENDLEKLCVLFSYLFNKDIFGDIYKNMLAKRLLDNKSKSFEQEKFIISQLKRICGSNFTSKYEGMINDLLSSSYLREHKIDSPIDFSATILTTGFWPTYKTIDLIIPPPMMECLSKFKTHYDTISSSRILTWYHILGTATLKYKICNKKYDLGVSTIQAVCLMLFTENKEYSFDEIKLGMNVDEDIVKKTLHSLSCGKYKILNKSQDTKTISNKETFSVNMKFTNNVRKFNIPMPSLIENLNIKKVEEDRTHQIEASVVRIMKARKTLHHQELMAETMRQLTLFKPNPRDIKIRIESLIERAYLERVEGTQEYKYLA